VDRTVLPPTHLAESTVDSAVLVAHIVEQGLDRLADTVRAVGAADPAARLNLLATDGTVLVATTWGDTLCILVTPDGTVVASEPYDNDPRWVDVPDRRLVRVAAGGVTSTPLEL
jgi:glutamine amidotransferase